MGNLPVATIDIPKLGPVELHGNGGTMVSICSPGYTTPDRSFIDFGRWKEFAFIITVQGIDTFDVAMGDRAHYTSKDGKWGIGFHRHQFSFTDWSRKPTDALKDNLNILLVDFIAEWATTEEGMLFFRVAEAVNLKGHVTRAEREFADMVDKYNAASREVGVRQGNFNTFLKGQRQAIGEAAEAWGVTHLGVIRKAVS